ncbi:MAG: hypothetical protein AAFR27_12660, partial [Pseudomonadota bacterium]
LSFVKADKGFAIVSYAIAIRFDADKQKRGRASVSYAWISVGNGRSSLRVSAGIACDGARLGP